MDWFFITAANAAETHQNAHGAADPMEQFHIVRYYPIKIFGYDASFTNASLWMLMAAALATAFLVYSMRGASLVPNRLQSVG